MTTRRTALAMAGAALMAPAAWACSMPSRSADLQRDVTRAYKRASVVVLARVVSAKFQGPLTSPFGEAPTHVASIEVIEKWKGKHEPGAVLNTFATIRAGTCAAVLAPGESHLLYLRGKGPYDLTLSPRSASLQDAAGDLEILRSRFGQGKS